MGIITNLIGITKLITRMLGTSKRSLPASSKVYKWVRRPQLRFISLHVFGQAKFELLIYEFRLTKLCFGKAVRELFILEILKWFARSWEASASLPSSRKSPFSKTNRKGKELVDEKFDISDLERGTSIHIQVQDDVLLTVVDLMYQYRVVWNTHASIPGFGGHREAMDRYVTSPQQGSFSKIRR